MGVGWGGGWGGAAGQVGRGPAQNGGHSPKPAALLRTGSPRRRPPRGRRALPRCASAAPCCARCAPPGQQHVELHGALQRLAAPACGARRVRGARQNGGAPARLGSLGVWAASQAPKTGDDAWSPRPPWLTPMRPHRPQQQPSSWPPPPSSRAPPVALMVRAPRPCANSSYSFTTARASALPTTGEQGPARSAATGRRDRHTCACCRQGPQGVHRSRQDILGALPGWPPKEAGRPLATPGLPPGSGPPAKATTLSCGAKRANSRCQLGRVESGTTTRCGRGQRSWHKAARKAMACTVLPSPIWTEGQQAGEAQQRGRIWGWGWGKGVGESHVEGHVVVPWAP